MQIILNVSPVVIEVFMAALLSLAVFRRRVSYAAFAGMLCGALGASLLFLHFLSNIGFRIPFSVILYTAWFSLAFYTEFRKALVLSCALVAYCFFGDAILLSPLLFVYSRSISLLEMSSHYPALSLYAKILELIGILLITRFVQRNARGKDRWISCGAKISIGLFAVSILINAAFFYAYRSNAANWGMRPETMLLILCTGLFIDFVSVLLLCILQFTSSRDEEIALKNSLKEAQSSVLLWAKAYEKERQHSHEFQNHLSCIYGLAENNTPKEDIMNYVNKLLTVTLPSIRYINTNNPVANVVFSQKDIIAHEKNISLLLDLDDLSAFPMKGDETAVFFSDLLDNAIEACEELPPEQKKYIKVMIHRKSSGYYLCINNPTAKPVTIRNNQVIFKPRHDQGRGFGIRNVLCRRKNR